MRSLVPGSLLGVLSLACAGLPDDPGDGGPSVATTVPAAPATEQRYAAGEEFAIGGYSYRIDTVTPSRSVGKGNAAKAAPEGALWVVVKYKLRNDGHKTESGTGSQLKLIDNAESEYAHSPEGTTAITVTGGPVTLSSEHPPGMWQHAAAVFLIPEGAWVGRGSLDLMITAGEFKAFVGR